MVKNILSFRSIAISLALLLIVVLSCQKERTISETEVLDEVTQALKKAFAEQELNSKLTKKFSDSLIISWSPSWEQAVQKIQDSTSFTYIPLEQKKLSNSKINLLNQFNYLIAKKRGSFISYYLGTYIRNADTSDNKAEMTLDSFTGGLLLEDLKTGIRYFYNYRNGVPNNNSKLNSFS